MIRQPCSLQPVTNCCSFIFLFFPFQLFCDRHSQDGVFHQILTDFVSFYSNRTIACGCKEKDGYPIVLYEVILADINKATVFVFMCYQFQTKLGCTDITIYRGRCTYINISRAYYFIWYIVYCSHTITAMYSTPQMCRCIHHLLRLKFIDCNCSI